MLSRFYDSYSTTIVVFVLCLCLLVNVTASKSPIVKIDYAYLFARLVIGDVVLQELQLDPSVVAQVQESEPSILLTETHKWNHGRHKLCLLIC